MKLSNLAIRSRVLRAVREFFYSQDFLEVETPARIPAPALETNIDTPPSGRAWLRASPELHMKRLLAEGCPRIFQIGPCFRSGECGRRHNPEFTMLEWYRAGADYTEILRDTEALFDHVFRTVAGQTSFTYRGAAIDLSLPWHCRTVREAYEKWAGWDPTANWDVDRFDMDMVGKVEPALPKDKPCVLTDYPAPAASLARLKADNPNVAERWEVYVGGLELANAYSELCDPAAQRARFLEAAEERRARGKEVYPLDEPFLAALERGLPPCGGIALGIDRLVMLACGADDIADARPFCQRPGELI
ncbi:MAG TPA: EF-P lysine aminoacylase EpmA [Kiritimatiellia bacterium]|nr:EF-P lysine aminoacylase EpmA [Kiritimatiellia bacterium]HPS07255.1 EF-P lysine aminoacylase EpmA [Kiritimatiellia bacterium]